MSHKSEREEVEHTHPGGDHLHAHKDEGLGASRGKTGGQVPASEGGEVAHSREVESPTTRRATQQGQAGFAEEVDKILERRGGPDVERPTDARPATTAAEEQLGQRYGRWEEAMRRYRASWQERQGAVGRWEDYEPAYRFGWESGNDPRHFGRSWAEVEPHLRREWEARHPGRPWERTTAEAVREAWEGGDDHSRSATERAQRIELREEQLEPRKRPVTTGEVAVRKEVVTEQKRIDVPVRREEAVIERQPVEHRAADEPAGTNDGTAAAGEPVGEEERIRIPLKEEKVTVEKQPVVGEEVEVVRQPVQETKAVSGNVRRETASVEPRGDVDVEEGSQ